MKLETRPPHSLLSLIGIAAVIATLWLMVATLPGCALFTPSPTPALSRWETAMGTYTAANNYAADLFDEGKLSREDLKAFQEKAGAARALLDTWKKSISPDGKTDTFNDKAGAELAAEALDTFLKSRRSP